MKKAACVLLVLIVVALGWNGLVVPAIADGPMSFVRADSRPLSYTYNLNLVAPITITQNTDPETIETGNTVVCGPKDGSYTTQNSLWRRFDLDGEFGLTDTLSIDSVTFGIEEASQPFTITVNMYTLEGVLNTDNLTLIGSGEIVVDEDSSGTLVTAPVTATAASTETLVVELNFPKGKTIPATVHPGSNRAGQSGPTYISAPDCAITQPVDMADIGFPDIHIIMVVAGETVGAPTALTVGDLRTVTNSTKLPGAAVAVAGLALVVVGVALFRHK